MDKITFFSLLDKYLDGRCNTTEVKLLEEYYRRLEADGLTSLSADEEQVVKQKMYRVIEERMHESPVRRLWNWRQVAVAASILIAVGIGSYFIFFNKSSEPGQQHGSELAEGSKDLPPGRDAAILSMADGRQILLDSASGTITNENGVAVVNLKGTLSYQQQGTVDGQPVYNTVTTARGNQYQLVLADGSRVWLNAASSLRFPTSFTGESREVELSGEGYFEIAHNPSKPFRVKTDKQVVEVLGTHFNINSYGDEAAVRTTLLEGSVRVSRIGLQDSKLLKPGEQAVLINNSTISIDQSPDLDKVMAWKNGWFEFDQLDLEAIMRQVSRWYDVDISYNSKPTDEKFGGRLSKGLPLSAVIEMMKANGVECSLNGKTLVVMP